LGNFHFAPPGVHLAGLVCSSAYRRAAIRAGAGSRRHAGAATFTGLCIDAHVLLPIISLI
jgi:hypothetical protein